MNYFKSLLRGAFQSLKRTKAFLGARLSEGSTWVGLGAVFAGAVGFTGMVQWAVVGCGIMGVLIKTTKSESAGTDA